MIFDVFYVHLFLSAIDSHVSYMWKIHGQLRSYFNAQQEADLLSLNLMYSTSSRSISLQTQQL